MSSDSAILVDPPPSLGCLDVPPLDPSFFPSASDNTVSDPNVVPYPDPEFDLDLDLDLDFFLDNAHFDLTFDDLYLPSETESFLIPNNDVSPSSASFEDRAPADCVPADCVVRAEADGEEARGGSPDGGISSGIVSSQGSGGGGGSRLSEDMNSPLPSSGTPDPNRDVSLRLSPEQKVKLEVSKNNSNSNGSCGNGLMKRKKDHDDAAVEIRTPKFRKSASKAEKNACSVGKVAKLQEDGDEKLKARLMRNRESAQLSRQRKKHHIEEMEEKIRVMQTTIADLNGKISYMMAENIGLRQQLSSATSGGMCALPPAMAPPPSGMYPYPYPPMPYPWVPCAPYVVKPQGSQVPLVPIPRLKPQQPATSSSAKVKKRDSKKVEPKSTRKVASISLLGVLFFMLMFGVLVPNVKVRYHGVGRALSGRSGHFGDRYHGEHYRQARVLTVSGLSNVSYHPTSVGSGSDSEEWTMHYRNGSEPLVASLYVPRNNKLVKIDGNLIIHSVLASEKALASEALSKTEDEATASALAIPGSMMIRGNRHVYRKPTESQKAISSGGREVQNDHMKATSAADGKLQQWFREGLAGPLLSSGMCSEVFRFDVSPASSGAIVPAPPARNITSVDRRNTTSDRTWKNRRILSRLPHRIAGSDTNITDRETRGRVKGEDLGANKSLSSSMVVSVLVDPREAREGEIDDVIRPNSISRIFVVVLMDSIKYVTYSCVLHRSSPGAHFVTT